MTSSLVGSEMCIRDRFTRLEWWHKANLATLNEEMQQLRALYVRGALSMPSIEAARTDAERMQHIELWAH
eukprot:1361658-Prorocentrum_lima.AAC.1